MHEVSLALIISTFIFGLISMAVAFFALVEVKAMQRSTHQVAFIDPSKQEFEKMTEDTKKVLEKEAFDNI